MFTDKKLIDGEAFFYMEDGHEVIVSPDLFATDPRLTSYMFPCMTVVADMDRLPKSEGLHPILSLYREVENDPFGVAKKLGVSVSDYSTRALCNMLYKVLYPKDETQLYVSYKGGHLILVAVTWPSDGSRAGVDETAQVLADYLNEKVYIASCDCGQAYGDLSGYGSDLEQVAEDFVREMCENV